MRCSWDDAWRWCQRWAFPLLMLSYTLFLLLGALLFMALEGPEEAALQAEARQRVRGFLQRSGCVRAEEVQEVLQKAREARRRGLAVVQGDTDASNCDFTSALYFITAFLTTTGYGDATPMSEKGKLFCMCYCLLGIPLTLLLLSCVTHRLVPHVTRRPVRLLHLRCGLPPGRAALLHALALSATIALLFFLLPAAGLCMLEPDWSFLESLYFCFISLSTIGLGDYLPGKTHNQALRQGLEFATSGYLLLGLVVLLVLLETFWELPQIKNLVRLVSGPTEGPLMSPGVEQLVLSEDPLAPEEEVAAQYMLPISTIYPCINEDFTFPYSLGQTHH